MALAKFKIGDRVRALTCTFEGEVTDTMFSLSTGWSYLVKNKGFFREADLELIPDKKGYSIDIKIDIASNVVIATLYEVTEDTKSPLAKGHGHMIHEGELGVVQAASYACKKLYESLGGTFVK